MDQAFMADTKIKFVNREISWLSFNSRVLQEAEDKSVPLIERLKFLGIFSSNLDEFFRVRVATLKRMAALGKGAKELLGENPAKVLKQIHDIVVGQQARFELIYKNIIKDLERNNIFILNETQLSPEQGLYIKSFFHDKVLPSLVPIMLNHAPKFPYLVDKSIYLAIRMFKASEPDTVKYSLIEVPRDVKRFVELPSVDNRNFVMLLDDVIRYSLEDIFSIFEFDTYEAYTIKLTRDAELDIDHDLSKSITEKISKSVKQRKTGQPVRMVYDSAMPRDILNFLLKKIKIEKGNSLIPGGRYHNFKDFMGFPKIGGDKFVEKEFVPLPHKLLQTPQSLFNVIRKKDVMLMYPYQSFDYIIDLLREASIDPKVLSIKITLYRVARSSNIVKALINAIKNGKSVTVVVELQARFDEEHNMYVANKLQDEGAKVLFGVPGLKVHSKMFIITRKEDVGMVNYAHIGTGNFNENTARVYSDISILTADPRITNEVERVFDFFKDNFKIGQYKHLIISPFYMRKRFVKLIQNEILNAQKGRAASITIKLNSLADHEMIRKLYQAAEEGVQVRIIIRSICSLVPYHPNMQVISIVDKFLEHARIMIFHNGGDEKFYISSADWMVRNLDHRTEVACPIYDNDVQRVIKKYIEFQLNDDKKARIINKKQDNTYKGNPVTGTLRSQDATYNYFLEKLKSHVNLVPDPPLVLPDIIK